VCREKEDNNKRKEMQWRLKNNKERQAIKGESGLP
jgi:hypothetical protein